MLGLKLNLIRERVHRSLAKQLILGHGWTSAPHSKIMDGINHPCPNITNVLWVLLNCLIILWIRVFFSHNISLHWADACHSSWYLQFVADTSHVIMWRPVWLPSIYLTKRSPLEPLTEIKDGCCSGQGRAVAICQDARCKWGAEMSIGPQWKYYFLSCTMLLSVIFFQGMIINIHTILQPLGVCFITSAMPSVPFITMV